MLRRLAATSLAPTTVPLPVRITLALAVAMAATVAPFVALDAAQRIDRHAGLDAAEEEDAVMRDLGVDPAVVAAVARALPPEVPYELRVSPEVGDQRGYAFVAWLGYRLLPRIRADRAEWVVRWGAAPIPRGARLVQRIDAAPAVLVYRR